MPALRKRPEVESAIHDRLQDGSSPSLLVVAGTRGAGKSSLLRGLAAEWPDGRPVALAPIEPLACSPEVLERELVRLGSAVLRRVRPSGPAGAASAFDALLASLRSRPKASVLLLDDVTEIQTLSYSPGVERPLERFVEALSGSRCGPVLATTRFGFRFARAFPAVARYPLPAWSAEEAAREGWPDPEELVAASGGVPAYLFPLGRARERERSVADALAVEMEPGGTVEAECRATMHELLHRARGYGACKSVLRVLADEEGLNLTEVARRLERTPGATRDYLRWLEEVDLIESRKKRFSFSHGVVRLWMRLYGRGPQLDERERREEIDGYLERAGRVESEAHAPAETPELDVEDYTLPPLPGSGAGAEDLVEID